jgi:Arc/MetJ-type ribon-helix-helix transcriptional regulator
VKLSVSLSDLDVEFLDTYAASQGIESRSAVLQRAVGLLRASELGPAYEDAWSEWDAGDGESWNVAVGDGLK